MLRQCVIRSSRFTSTRNSRQTHTSWSRSSTSTPKTPKEDDWRLYLATRLASAIALTHIVTEYGVDVTLCEGPSMLPTIKSHGEIILFDRLSPRWYGLEMDGAKRAQQARQEQESSPNPERWHQVLIPANQFPPHGKWRRFWTRLTTGISVGDVVVVQHPERPGTVCKRVLGLPGDVIVMPPKPSLVPRRYKGGKPRRQTLYVIPDGNVWIEGDNGLNSTDSRSYGAVPAALIVGRVLCRVWPLRGNALFERGARPSGMPGGSTILPAGYEGEEIVKHNDKSQYQ